HRAQVPRDAPVQRRAGLEQSDPRVPRAERPRHAPVVLMRYTRVYASEDGESHFEDAETAGETTKALESDLVGTVSETFPVTGIYFREVHQESSDQPHN